MNEDVLGASPAGSSARVARVDARLLMCAAIAITSAVIVGDMGFGVVIAAVAAMQVVRAHRGGEDPLAAYFAVAAGATAIFFGLLFGQAFDVNVGQATLLGLEWPLSRVEVAQWVALPALVLWLACLVILIVSPARAARDQGDPAGSWRAALPRSVTVAVALTLGVLASSVVGTLMMLVAPVVWIMAKREARRAEGRERAVEVLIAFICAAFLAAVLLELTVSLLAVAAGGALGSALYAAATWFSLEPLPTR
jgi:hypothetical protein